LLRASSLATTRSTGRPACASRDRRRRVRLAVRGWERRCCGSRSDSLSRWQDQYGCIGILVDAKAGAISFYERLGFICLTAVEGASDIRPAPTPLFLSIQKIRAAGRTK